MESTTLLGPDEVIDEDQEEGLVLDLPPRKSHAEINHISENNHKNDINHKFNHLRKSAPAAPSNFRNKSNHQLNSLDTDNKEEPPPRRDGNLISQSNFSRVSTKRRRERGKAIKINISGLDFKTWEGTFERFPGR